MAIPNIFSFLPYINNEEWTDYNHDQGLQTLVLAFLIAVCIVLFTIPLTIRFCKKYDIFDNPNLSRKKHRSKIPHLGGVNIFLGMFVAFVAIAPLSTLDSFKYIFTAIFFLLILGLWDDIRSLSPWMKLFWQLIISILIIGPGEAYLDNLFGLFGYYDISSTYTSYIISLIIILTIINGINLLDGINALSAGLTLMLSFFYLLWFLFVGFYGLALFSTTLCGAALAFLWYNWSPASIFLGDSGAMILGLSISFLTLSFLQSNSNLLDMQSKLAILHAPIIAIAALLLPILDTSRVFILRVIQGKSPLSADRNHIHHKFVDAGFPHIQATLILLSCQLAIIFIAMASVRLSYLISSIVIFVSLLVFYLGFGVVIQHQKNNAA